MRALSRDVIAHALGGTVFAGLEGPAFRAVFTDTRKALPGALFVALQGERFDAHDFLASAIEAGAAGVIISRVDALPEHCPPELFVLVVEDTMVALGALARLVRAGLDAKVVAVTGSVGKTTVKDMITAALAAHGKVGATPGNYNNEIGLPLSLFALDGDEDYVVLELGMSAPGEIAELTRTARPDVGIVTNASAAHLAFFASVDAIADAKAELYENLMPEAQLVVNQDDARMRTRAEARRPRHMVSWGRGQGATVALESITQSTEGVSLSVRVNAQVLSLHLPGALGVHNAHNAAAAMAVVHALGLDLQAAASALSLGFAPAPHRMNVLAAMRGLTVLDDCYNANPASARAALEALALIAADGVRGAVLGSMLELGPQADALHEDLGRVAVASGISWLAATGPHREATAEGARKAGLSQIHVAEDAKALVDPVCDFAAPGHWLLLKGSRGEGLERLLSPLGARGDG